jgi:hypothetical protein
VKRPVLLIEQFLFLSHETDDYRRRRRFTAGQWSKSKRSRRDSCPRRPTATDDESRTPSAIASRPDAGSRGRRRLVWRGRPEAITNVRRLWSSATIVRADCAEAVVVRPSEPLEMALDLDDLR